MWEVWAWENGMGWGATRRLSDEATKGEALNDPPQAGIVVGGKLRGFSVDRDDCGVVFEDSSNVGVHCLLYC